MRASHTKSVSGRAAERGVTMVAFLTALVPLVLIVAAMTQAMMQRTAESQSVIDLQKALLAADAGIDEATYRGATGALTDGVAFDVDIDGDGNAAAGPTQCRVTPTWLRADGIDNDGDLAIDEIDEDVFQVVAVGTFKTSRRRIAAYLGPVPILPSIESAVIVSNPSVSVNLGGSSLLSGVDVTLNGVPTGNVEPGMAIASPGTLAWLDSQLTGTERTRVVGSGGLPSLSTTGAIDWGTLVPQLQNVANTVLTSNNYSGLMVGSTSPWRPRIALRNGNVTIQGISTGVGILVVNGDLQMRGTFTWYGVIICTGQVRCSSGNALIRGALLQTTSGPSVIGTGNLMVQYSTEAIALATAASGRYSTFNGWQELARQ